MVRTRRWKVMMRKTRRIMKIIVMPFNSCLIINVKEVFEQRAKGRNVRTGGIMWFLSGRLTVGNMSNYFDRTLIIH
jgi:hypothetical protein